MPRRTCAGKQPPRWARSPSLRRARCSRPHLPIPIPTCARMRAGRSSRSAGRPQRADMMVGAGPATTEAASSREPSLHQAPDAIVLERGGARLRLEWSSAGRVGLTAPRLRNGCRCARCARARAEGAFSAPSSDIAIERVELVGDYGLTLAFSDGHARGIYPWAYLRELARGGG